MSETWAVSCNTKSRISWQAHKQRMYGSGDCGQLSGSCLEVMNETPSSRSSPRYKKSDCNEGLMLSSPLSGMLCGNVTLLTELVSEEILASLGTVGAMTCVIAHGRRGCQILARTADSKAI